MGLFKDVKENLTGDDVREGLVAVISVKLPQPQFEGQTKGKLNSDIAGHGAGSSSTRRWARIFEQEPDRRDARSSTRRSKPRARVKRRARPAISPAARARSMAAACPASWPIAQERDPERCELFLVEGESAGGTAKQGRDRRFQAILPLKGKILNVEKARYDKMLGHEEIRAMITALGTGIGKDDFDLAKLRYGKIIIMTDADVDGIAHPHAAAHVLLPPHAGADQARQRLHRAAAAVLASRRARAQKYIKDDDEFVKVMLKRAAEGMIVRYGEGAAKLEGAGLSKFMPAA